MRIALEELGVRLAVGATPTSRQRDGALDAMRRASTPGTPARSSRPIAPSTKPWSRPRATASSRPPTPGCADQVQLAILTSLVEGSTVLQDIHGTP